MGDVWESDGVVVETWESSTEPGVTFTTVIREGDIVTGGSGGDLSDAAPQDLGTAAAGTSEDASRADHVHDMPTPAQIGALPDDTVIPDITGLQATSEKNQPNGYAGLDGDGTIPDNRIPSSIARDTEIGTQITAHDGSGTAHSDIRALMPLTIPHVPGLFYSLNGGQSVSTYAALTTGRLAAHPVWLPAGTYNLSLKHI